MRIGSAYRFLVLHPVIVGGVFFCLRRVAPLIILRETEETLPGESVGVLGEASAALGLYFQKFRLDDLHDRDNRGQRHAFREAR